jgi:pimeloyl-ACP methyl ester carboxylesterase
MPDAVVSGGSLVYEVLDVTVPWLPAPDTILFHHGLGATRGVWAEWRPHLADGFRVVTFDMRGHGRSASPARDVAVTLDVMADLKSRLPQARLHVFPRARHGLPFSHARDCATAVRRFLEAAPAQRTRGGHMPQHAAVQP